MEVSGSKCERHFISARGPGARIGLFIFLEFLGNLLGFWNEYFFIRGGEGNAKEGDGQDPGWLSGKINELKWVQPVCCYLDGFGGCTHRYSNILMAIPRINELLLLKDCWMKYLSTDEYM